MQTIAPFLDGALAIPLLIIKVFAASYGARLTLPHCPDRLAAWLCAWTLLQAALFAFIFLTSLMGWLGPSVIWAFVLVTAITAFAFGSRAAPLGVRELVRLNVIGPNALFLALLIALSVRASIFFDFSKDAQTYGLVRNALWMNFGSVLINMPSPHEPVFTYEWNGDLISCVYGLAADNIQGLMFGNIEILLFCYVAFCWLAVRLGASLGAATMIGVAVAGAPVCLGLSGALKGDLLSCGALAMAVGWLTAIDGPHRSMALIMIPASAALAVGAKLTTLPAAAVIGVVYLAMIWRAPRALSAVGIGAVLAIIFGARFGLNAIYGSLFIHAETKLFAWRTFTNNVQFLSSQALQYAEPRYDNIQLASLLSAGFGLTGLLALVFVFMQWMQGIAPDRRRLWIFVASLAVVIGMATFIPKVPWSFRYYAPTVIVGAIAMMSFRIDRLPPASRAFLTLGFLVCVGMNAAWYMRLGDANANRSLRDAIAVATPLTPIQRATLAESSLPENMHIEGVNFDGEKPLTFAVFQELDAPISPLVGSRAQNRIYFTNSMEKLVVLAKSVHADFVVITKHKIDPIDDGTQKMFSDQGYSWLKNGPFAAIAGIKAPQ